MKYKLLFGAALLTTAMSANAILAVVNPDQLVCMPTFPAKALAHTLQIARAQYAKVLKEQGAAKAQALLVEYVACGLDPTKITSPAGFGGFGGFPDVVTVPQSLGGDPVSPS